jgi:hypothetical protein
LSIVGYGWVLSIVGIEAENSNVLEVPGDDRVEAESHAAIRPPTSRHPDGLMRDEELNKGNQDTCII